MHSHSANINFSHVNPPLEPHIHSKSTCERLLFPSLHKLRVLLTVIDTIGVRFYIHTSLQIIWYSTTPHSTHPAPTSLPIIPLHKPPHLFTLLHDTSSILFLKYSRKHSMGTLHGLLRSFLHPFSIQTLLLPVPKPSVTPYSHPNSPRYQLTS